MKGVFTNIGRRSTRVTSEVKKEPSLKKEQSLKKEAAQKTEDEEPQLELSIIFFWISALTADPPESASIH